MQEELESDVKSKEEAQHPEELESGSATDSANGDVSGGELRESSHNNRDRRLAMNRVSAKLRRDRKRYYLTDLEEKVNALNATNKKLAMSNMEMQHRISEVKLAMMSPDNDAARAIVGAPLSSGSSLGNNLGDMRGGMNPYQSIQQQQLTTHPNNEQRTRMPPVQQKQQEAYGHPLDAAGAIMMNTVSPSPGAGSNTGFPQPNLSSLFPPSSNPPFNSLLYTTSQNGMRSMNGMNMNNIDINNMNMMSAMPMNSLNMNPVGMGMMGMDMMGMDMTSIRGMLDQRANNANNLGTLPSSMVAGDAPMAQSSESGGNPKSKAPSSPAPEDTEDNEDQGCNQNENEDN